MYYLPQYLSSFHKPASAPCMVGKCVWGQEGTLLFHAIHFRPWIMVGSIERHMTC